jgi:hypothetical protein
LPICFIMCHHRLNFHPISHVNHTFPTISPPILRNHTPPINSPYWPLVFCVNVKPQPYIFPNPLNHAHVGPFSPSTLPALLVAHAQTLNLPSFPQHICNFHLKFFAPLVGANLLVEGLFVINVPIKHPIHLTKPPWPSRFNTFPCSHPLASAWVWVSFLDVLGSFHLGFCYLWLYNRILAILWHDVQVVFHFPLDKLM